MNSSGRYIGWKQHFDARLGLGDDAVDVSKSAQQEAEKVDKKQKEAPATDKEPAFIPLPVLEEKVASRDGGGINPVTATAPRDPRIDDDGADVSKSAQLNKMVADLKEKIALHNVSMKASPEALVEPSLISLSVLTAT